MNKLKTALSKLVKEKPLVKVYSHPRSGTHFLEAFLAKNFYKKKDLKIEEIAWGHWSNRKIKKEGNLYGKLFGNHYFANRNTNDQPKIYIYRDGRAVAYSIWKTPNFLNKEDSKLSFNAFLNTKIDWQGTPSLKVDPKLTIFEHWSEHFISWRGMADKNDNILMIRYEDLKDQPYEVYKKIHAKFFKKQQLLLPNEIDEISKPLGLLPNQGIKDAWKEQIELRNSDVYKALVLKNSIDDEL